MPVAEWVRCLATLLSFAIFAFGAQNVTNLGKPVSIPASQYWDGKDGPWSTFRIEVGTVAQQIRVLPASSQSSTWLVLSEACTDDSSCSENRGRVYQRDNSSTWEEYGSYELNTFLEERVGLDGDGLYGYDTLGLGWTGDDLPSLEHQLLAGILTEDFYIGSLAVNPRPTNFTNFNDPIPSLIQSLKNSNTPIPSSSWSYTAGGYNLSPKVFGSLVLGGYDTTRFTPNDLTFPFGADISLDFQVAIQSITTNASDTSLLSNGIISYLDTLVAEIWLPTAACKKFEDTFGLVWDDQSELYLLNDSLHDSLLSKNPVISFKLGPEVNGDSVTIDLPYWNWYLTATSALLGNHSGLYFPLKRAANDSQYVLGRTFLQSAHISADYERNVFNLSQALYPSTSTSESIVAILPILEETPGAGGGGNGNNNNPGGKSSSGLGTGAIAGIAVGGAIIALAIAAVTFILRRRRKRTKEEEAHELEDTDAHGNRAEMSGDELKHEVDAGMRHEVGGDQYKAELSALADQQKPAEIDGSTRPIFEMPAGEIKFAEMEGEGHGHVDKKSPMFPDVNPDRRGTDATNNSDAFGYAEDDLTPLTPPTHPVQRPRWEEHHPDPR
ncbi:aspartic peptidase domain-containing protein [Lophiotrema nucula]|uniref:Aspartic peptidase domain-containing protein n=1 Tax=Lophiotrema nucula TaxID=690887 RepID=A0A6A5YPY8_9PLEO|nr:aspartic peptidase domain-containing protein [Lophiotrema nucula]